VGLVTETACQLNVLFGNVVSPAGKRVAVWAFVIEVRYV